MTTFEWNEKTVGCVRSTADWTKYVPADEMEDEPRTFPRGVNP